jgi:hypothetical protein
LIVDDLSKATCKGAENETVAGSPIQILGIVSLYLPPLLIAPLLTVRDNLVCSSNSSDSTSNV